MVCWVVPVGPLQQGLVPCGPLGLLVSMLPAVCHHAAVSCCPVLSCCSDGVGINPSQTAGVYAGFRVVDGCVGVIPSWLPTTSPLAG